MTKRVIVPSLESFDGVDNELGTVFDRHMEVVTASGNLEIREGYNGAESNDYASSLNMDFHDVMNCVGVLHGSLESEFGGINERTAAVLKIALNHIAKRNDYVFEPGRQMVSLETFASVHTRQIASRLTLEHTVIDVFLMIFHRFFDLVKWVWETIYNFTAKLLNREMARRRAITLQEISKRERELVSKTSGNVRINATPSFMAVVNKEDVAKPFLNYTHTKDDTPPFKTVIQNNMRLMEGMVSLSNQVQTMFAGLRTKLIKARELIEADALKVDKDIENQTKQFEDMSKSLIKTVEEGVFQYTQRHTVAFGELPEGTAFTLDKITGSNKTPKTADSFKVTPAVAGNTTFYFAKYDETEPLTIVGVAEPQMKPSDTDYKLIRFPTLKELEGLTSLYKESVSFYDGALSKSLEKLLSMKGNFIKEAEATVKTAELLAEQNPTMSNEYVRDLVTTVKDVQYSVLEIVKMVSLTMLNACSYTNRCTERLVKETMAYYEAGAQPVEQK